MKKRFLFIVFLLMSVGLYAQCPISVGITSVPDITTVSVCKSTSVVLTANQSIGAITPIYYWIINGDTILGTDSTITIFANNQTVNLIMSTLTGCSPDSAFATIQISTVLIQPTITPTPNCDLTKADITITSTGGSSPYNYDLLGIGTSTTGNYTDVPAGTYTLYITDSQGCNDTSQIITVTPIPIVMESTPTPLPTECNQTTFDVITSTTGGTAPYSYDLQGVGQSSDGSFIDVSVGAYTLITTDSKGCIDTSTVSIVPVTCPPPSPIEVMTPNDDGLNDMWVISNIQYYPNNEVFIFDRWGQRVYHKKNYDNIDGWKAKYIGLDMPVSTYYYVLKVKFQKSEDQIYKGPISIFR